LVVVLVVAGILTAWASWRGAPFVPTPQKAVLAALDLAKVGNGDVLVDVGAGDGRVLVAAIKRGADAVGFELSPFLWIIAKANLLFNRSEAKLLLRDGFNADFSGVNVIFLFLMPKTLPVLLAKLKKTAKPGTRIITYSFPLSGFVERGKIKPERCGTIYLYEV